MAQDVIKQTGTIKSSKPDAGGANLQNLPMFGIVKDNIDPTRSGRIKVLLADKPPPDSDDASKWVTVSYMSNFFGKLDGSAGTSSDSHGNYKSNPTSYGEWHAPPDIGTKVICIFVNGDSNYGYYIGCVPEAETLQMVPAIGSSDNVVPNSGEAQSYGGAVRLPVTNFNTNNASANNSPDFNNTPRPIHSYTATIMNQQGIIRDPIRGPISSSASREATSRVGWGVSTPGRPIYEGGYDDATVAQNLTPNNSTQLKIVARRGGHSIVMDDGDIIGRDQLIRIRTALGHQILMSDDGQTLMILHSNGQSYIELGKEGTIDMFSTNSVNIRTQGDLNLHADRNINIHAMENFNIQANAIQTNSETTTKMRVGSDFNMSTTGAFTGLIGSALAMQASGDASLVAGGQAYVNGSKVNLNSGSPSTTPQAVTRTTLIAQTDTLFDQTKGFVAAPAKLLTIASRAPAHAPWANAGQGVDVKTNPDASANLPAESSPAVQSTTSATASNATPPAVATVASAPSNTPPVSDAVDSNTTSAAVAQVATTAASGPLSDAVSQGAAVVNTAQGNVAAVGSFAQTASQLAQGGVLKPGADTLVNSLVQSGANITQAMPSSVFTGAAGATDLSSLVQSSEAQTNSLVGNMQQAQTALGQAGVITGAESPVQVTGMVTAAATVGLGPTIDAVQQVGGIASSVSSAATQSVVSSVTAQLGAATNTITGISGASGALSSATSALTGAASTLTGASSVAGSAAGVENSLSSSLSDATSSALGSTNAALSAIGGGAAAAGLAQSIGGLGGVQSALTGMGQVPSLSTLTNETDSVATSAFNAVKDSFKPLQADVPQNLSQIASSAAATAAATASQTTQTSSSLLDDAGSVANSVTGDGTQIPGASAGASGLTGALSSATNAIGSATGALSTVAGAAISASGVSSLVSSVGGASSALAGVNNSVASITGGITSATNAVTSSLGDGSAITSTIGGVSGVASSISNSVTNSPLNTTIGGVQNAVNSVSSFAGAGPSIAQGGLTGLSNAATVVQSGVAAATSSALASGISNLPGGINTVSNVVNQATGANNSIPVTGALTSAIQSAQSAAMNGLSSVTNATGALSSASDALNSVTGAVGSATGSLTSAAADASSLASGALGDAANQLGGLTSIASSGLSVGSTAQLQSAVSSLSGGLPGGISLPSVAFNTNDRDSITSQITSTLDDPGIPAPNLTGAVSTAAESAIDDAASSAQSAFESAQAQLDAQIAVAASAYSTYVTAQANLPPGDPGVDAAYQAYHDVRYGPAFTSAMDAYAKSLDDLDDTE